MAKNGALLVLFGIGALALLTSETAGASAATTWFSDLFEGPPVIPLEQQPPSLQAKIEAMLATIRIFESDDDYTVIYGGGHFSDFSQHPNRRVPINLPGYEGKFSTAAGAYQINYPTYKEFARKAQVTDFSPASQDAIAYALLIDSGAVSRLTVEDIAEAFRLASRRWASLPGSTANQHPQPLQYALDTYALNLA